MASTTFTLPLGEKVRTQTNRRFVLIRRLTVIDYPDTQPTSAAIMKRSNDPKTLHDEMRRLRNKGYRGQWFQGDTSTGRVVQL